MKTRFITILVILVTVGIYANPAENFKAAGIGFGGSMSFQRFSNNFANDTDEAKSTNSYLRISPQLQFFVVDNFSLYTTLNLRISHRESYNWDLLEFEETGTSSIGLGVGANFYFPSEGNIVPAIAFGGGLNRVDDGLSGYESLWLEWDLSVTPKVYFFLSENAAVYGSFKVGIYNLFSLRSSDGERYEYPDDHDHMQYLDLATEAAVGITIFIPHSKRFIIRE